MRTLSIPIIFFNDVDIIYDFLESLKFILFNILLVIEQKSLKITPQLNFLVLRKIINVKRDK